MPEPIQQRSRGPLIAGAALLLLLLVVVFLRGPAPEPPPPRSASAPIATNPPAPEQAASARAANGPAPAAPQGAPPPPSAQPPQSPQAEPTAPAPRPSQRPGQRIDYFSIDERTRNLFYRQFKAQRGAEVERCTAAYRPPTLKELEQKARHERHSEPPVGAPFTWVQVDLEIDFEPYTDGYAFGKVEASTAELDSVGPEDSWTIALDEPTLADCIARAFSEVRVPVRGVTAGPSSKLVMRQTLTLPVNPQ